MAVTITILKTWPTALPDGTAQIATSIVLADNGLRYMLTVGNIPGDTLDVQAYLNARAADLWGEAVAYGQLADPNVLTDKVNLEDLIARWRASAIYGKTPVQIYTLMQGAMDGWTSLADARASLRVWLPLMAAALAWTIMRENQRNGQVNP